MGCGTNIVPGYGDFNKIKDPALQMKMDSLIAAQSVGPTLKENTAFNKWFGKSKVVDKNGNPMRVHHGSPNVGFTKFDIGKANPNDPDSPVNGFFFSTSKYDANTAGKFPYYAKQTGQNQTRSFYLKIENPINRRELHKMHRDLMESGIFLNKEQMRKHLIKKGYDGLILNDNYFELEDSLMKDGYYKTTDGSNIEFEVMEDGTVAMFRGNKTVGGITVFSDVREAAESQTGTYVAFNPKQIKSASANKGRYGSSSNVYK
jgi:hypothetical protein